MQKSGLTVKELKSLSTEELTKLRETSLKMADKYRTERAAKTILINSVYGAAGNIHFPLYNHNRASVIRKRLQQSQKQIFKYKHQAVKIENILTERRTVSS